MVARLAVFAALLGCAHAWGKKGAVEDGPRRKGSPAVEVKDYPTLGTCVDWTTQRLDAARFQLLGKVEQGAARVPNREGTVFSGDSGAIEWTVREMPDEAEGEWRGKPFKVRIVSIDPPYPTPPYSTPPHPTPHPTPPSFPPGATVRATQPRPESVQGRALLPVDTPVVAAPGEEECNLSLQYRRIP